MNLKPVRESRESKETTKKVKELMNKDIAETLTAGDKSAETSCQMNGTGTLSLDFASTGSMSTMPVVSAANHPLTTAEHRL